MNGAAANLLQRGNYFIKPTLGATDPNAGFADANFYSPSYFNASSSTAFVGSASPKYVMLGKVRFYTGTGTPSSAINAPSGSLFLSSNNGGGSALYVRQGLNWVAK